MSMPLLKQLKQAVENLNTEIITNENGTAIKYADGTMICYGTKVLTQNYGTTTFPVEFKTSPIGFVSLTATNSSEAQYIVAVETKSLTKCNIFARKTDGTTITAGTPVTINWQAIGIWK